MSKLNIFEAVKQHVTTRQAASFYGLKVNKSGMCCCPFHPDKTPSMKVDTRYHCFGCGADGDVVSFVQRLFDLKPYQAARKLAEDFCLMLSEKTPLPVKRGTHRDVRRLSIDAAQLDDAVKRIYRVYCDYLYLLNQWAQKHAPRSPDEEYHPLFVEAMHKRDYVNYLLDILFYGSETEKAEVAIEKGKGVRPLERRIAQYKCGKAEYASLSYAGDCSGYDRGTGYGIAGSDG